MNKRGFSLAWETIFDIMIVMIIVISCVVFVNSAASGRFMQKQVIAKEVCTMILAAENNSVLFVDSSNFLLEKRITDVVVKESATDLGYSYPCYLTDTIIFEKLNDKTKISIQR